MAGYRTLKNFCTDFPTEMYTVRKTPRMIYAIPLLSLLALILMLLPVFPAAADSGLQGGGTVTVDPNTNRATITRDGVSAPLWDGTHLMEDGSVLIIRQGVSVPKESVVDTRKRPIPKAAQWEGMLIVGYSPCEKLVQQTCGMDNQCEDTEACSLARQLLGMEQDEREASESHNRMTYTSGECREVSVDKTLFPVCQ